MAKFKIVTLEQVRAQLVDLGLEKSLKAFDKLSKQITAEFEHNKRLRERRAAIEARLIDRMTKLKAQADKYGIQL